MLGSCRHLLVLRAPNIKLFLWVEIYLNRSCEGRICIYLFIYLLNGEGKIPHTVGFISHIGETYDNQADWTIWLFRLWSSFDLLITIVKHVISRLPVNKIFLLWMTNSSSVFAQSNCTRTCQEFLLTKNSLVKFYGESKTLWHVCLWAKDLCVWHILPLCVSHTLTVNIPTHTKTGCFYPNITERNTLNSA